MSNLLIFLFFIFLFILFIFLTLDMHLSELSVSFPSLSHSCFSLSIILLDFNLPSLALSFPPLCLFGAWYLVLYDCIVLLNVCPFLFLSYCKIFWAGLVVWWMRGQQLHSSSQNASSNWFEHNKVKLRFLSFPRAMKQLSETSRSSPNHSLVLAANQHEITLPLCKSRDNSCSQRVTNFHLSAVKVQSESLWK